MSESQLFRPTSEITVASGPEEKLNVQALTSDQCLLLRAMVDAYSHDKVTSERSRSLVAQHLSATDRQSKKSTPYISEQELSLFIKDFRKSPRFSASIIQNNFIHIVNEELPEVKTSKNNLFGKIRTAFEGIQSQGLGSLTKVFERSAEPEHPNKEVLRQYLKAYLDLLPLLDRIAFPPQSPDTVEYGVPEYLPEGLSDMGGDPRIGGDRNRERIRVQKKPFYDLTFEILLDIMWDAYSNIQNSTSEQTKLKLAASVIEEMHRVYEYRSTGVPLDTSKSVPIHQVGENRDLISVCRHQALATQLLFQAVGLESRLLKCVIAEGPHVANLFRANNQWYLADTTNPEADPESSDPSQTRPFIRPIDLLGKPQQIWTFKKFGRDQAGNLFEYYVWYESRNNMYYRIMDNEKNPPGGVT